MRSILAAIMLMTTLTTWAGDHEDGMAAYGKNTYPWGGMYKPSLTNFQTYAEAIRWYTLAAEQGYARAQFNLGLLYKNGGGVVTQDYAEAVRWYTLAAEQGNARAQFNLAFCITKAKV